ncbi:XrtA/PEP-CTERM system amidotransferase [Lacimicrobium alkaliphilum]|uniref:asparagine synthase (glutamine-hydrolyzing) n=1 Tax=Lacimicrobium alkaliphilum TaxID=1526571 RepID=A0A0U2JII5_9ALTE|nr:XrtA/PEP-CTERM system amidotransferase [Lacimicrobium alkaliphilum]ALS97654.1 asparagine synthetase B [Lacimicrobium alkaliphilum]
MCGIAGIFQLASEGQPSEAVLAKMNNIQEHRGPDAGDYFFDPGVGLAHRRLSIIDLEGSPQPMLSADQRACIVFNGEIYNFKELHAELESKGYKFNTHGDTETILNAYLEWGEDCVQHLRGMFAFAIWDREKQKLFMARDRIGIKPFFYSLLPTGEFVFGSELKVLTEHPAFDRKLRDTTIEDYFTFGYVPEPYTVYQNSFKLSPGHTLTLEKGMRALPEPKQYWDIPTQWDADLSADEVQGELIERLKQAVDIRLVADVPLGAFLSGGVDSSGIVALMSQLQSDPVNTCAIGFDVKAFNETEFAQMVADRYHTNHRVETVQQTDFDLIDKLAFLYDEPYADSSAMPTYRVCELARKHVTVALSGDGGDELFAGYRRYKMHLHEEKIRNMLPLGLRKPIFGPLGRLYPKMDWAPKFLRAKTTFQSMAMDTVQGYHNSMSILRADERAKLFSKEFQSSLNGYNSLEVFNRYADKVKGLDPMKIAQYLDMKTYLVGDILTKVDRASMAHSLEVRVPILDHKFVEWAFKSPSDHNLHNGIGKYSFKKSLEPHLPHDVLYRKKMGFAVPLADWFKGPLKDRLYDGLLSKQMTESGYFSGKQLKRLIDDHVSGVRDNSAPLWTLMMFESFMRQQLGKAA